LVYSIISLATFQLIPELHRQIVEIKETNNVSVILIGNKSDLESQRQVSVEDGSQLAENFVCTFYETSAKTNTNVEVIFYEIVKQIIPRLPPDEGKKRHKHCCLL